MINSNNSSYHLLQYSSKSNCLLWYIDYVWILLNSWYMIYLDWSIANILHWLNSSNIHTFSAYSIMTLLLNSLYPTILNCIHFHIRIVILLLRILFFSLHLIVCFPLFLILMICINWWSMWKIINYWITVSMYSLLLILR